jgi:hypothetical protein
VVFALSSTGATPQRRRTVVISEAELPRSIDDRSSRANE